MQYVTYIALMFGAAHTKQIIIDINEDEIKKGIQIETQEFGKLFGDPAFKAAANGIVGDGVNELAKAQAKFITHERGILMPAVKALTRAMDAAFLLEDEDCNKALLESCLSARPRAINPILLSHDWEHGRLTQCLKQSECAPKLKTWSREHQREKGNKIMDGA